MKLLAAVGFWASPRFISAACCWCGKRYEPLPGYWEGVESESVADRLELVFAASRVVVVVPPALHTHYGTRLVVKSADRVVLNETLYPSSAQHFHSFAINSEPGRGLVATVWQGNTLVYSAADVGAPRPLAPFTHDDVSIYPFGWFINYGAGRP
jgi:hypothetical protein